MEGGRLRQTCADGALVISVAITIGCTGDLAAVGFEITINSSVPVILDVRGTGCDLVRGELVGGRVVVTGQFPHFAEVPISGRGSPAIGLHGRGAAVLDAVGLVFPVERP